MVVSSLLVPHSVFPCKVLIAMNEVNFAHRTLCRHSPQVRASISPARRAAATAVRQGAGGPLSLRATLHSGHKASDTEEGQNY